ncbi:hypothetical protein EB821_01035 [Candidatus Marinimicrobia bacterium PRS2]|nr:hypothetical protein EB821_01035 [Candidatus Marinimicrobia bacterium PRS2]
MKPPIKPSSYFKPHQLIDGNSFNKLIDHYDDINKTIYQFNIFDKATSQLALDISKEVTGYNFIRCIRLLWDYEIHKDACIESVPIIRQIDSMKSWVPYPMIDKGASYMAYKKSRFSSEGNLGVHIGDEIVLDLFTQYSDNDASNELVEPIKDIPTTNFTRTDYIDLLKRYEQRDYVPSNKDKEIESSSSFRKYYSEYIKQNNYDKNLTSICAELKKQFQMEYSKVIDMLKPLSKFYEDKLVNMLEYQFNNGKGTFYNKKLRLERNFSKGKKLFILVEKA